MRDIGTKEVHLEKLEWNLGNLVGYIPLKLVVEGNVRGTHVFKVL